MPCVRHIRECPPVSCSIDSGIFGRNEIDSIQRNELQVALSTKQEVKLYRHCFQWTFSLALSCLCSALFPPGAQLRVCGAVQNLGDCEITRADFCGPDLMVLLVPVAVSIC
jgi:hypothetical protein